LRLDPMNHCKDCRFFQDAHYSKTYITPICTVHGSDDCAFMRQYVCTLDGRLFEPISPNADKGTVSLAAEID